MDTNKKPLPSPEELPDLYSVLKEKKEVFEILAGGKVTVTDIPAGYERGALVRVMTGAAGTSDFRVLWDKLVKGKKGKFLVVIGSYGATLLPFGKTKLELVPDKPIMVTPKKHEVVEPLPGKTTSVVIAPPPIKITPVIDEVSLKEQLPHQIDKEWLLKMLKTSPLKNEKYDDIVDPLQVFYPPLYPKLPTWTPLQTWAMVGDKYKNRKVILRKGKALSDEVVITEEIRKALVPDTLSPQAKESAQKGLQGLTYDKLAQLQTHIEAALADSSGVYAKTLVEHGYTHNDFVTAKKIVDALWLCEKPLEYSETATLVANKYDLEVEDLNALFEFRALYQPLLNLMGGTQPQFLKWAAPATKIRMMKMGVSHFYVLLHEIDEAIAMLKPNSKP